MKKKAAFICNSTSTVDRVYYPELREKMSAVFDFAPSVYGSRELEGSLDELSDAVYLFSTWGMPHIESADVRRFFPSAKALFYGAGSVQGFAREFLENGIAVFSAWGANGYAVAEFTVAQILLATKGYFNRIHRPSHGVWDTRSTPYNFTGNRGAKIGIIGAGMIGRQVINMLKYFGGFDVFVFDPFLPDDAAVKLGVVKTDLHTLFSTCGVVSNHLANNEKTRGMIDYSCFSLMPENGVFINTGRGAQVVEDDMIRALKEYPGRIALLDVTDPEPPKPDSELYKLENVFLSPHIAGTLGNEVWSMADVMWEECLAFDAGEPTRYGVTLKMLETMA